MNNQQSSISGSDIQAFLQTITPFNLLSVEERRYYLEQMKPLRFRMGQKMLINTQMPRDLLIIFTGKVRLIGIEPDTGRAISLKVLEAGEMLGWISLLRAMPSETALASEETICFVLPAAAFSKLLHQHPSTFNIPHRSEIFDLITRYFQHQNLVLPPDSNLFQLTRAATQSAIISQQLPALHQGQSDRLWFNSQAEAHSLGLSLTEPPSADRPQRLVGIPAHLITAAITVADQQQFDDSTITPTALIDYAPDLDFQITNSDFTVTPTQIPINTQPGKFPTVHGQGQRDGILACFQMLSMYLGIKYRRDTVQRMVDLQLSRNNQTSLQLCAAIADVLGLMGRLIEIPANQIGRISSPAIIPWQDSYAVIYQANPQQIVLGTPQAGVQKMRSSQLGKILGNSQASIPVLLLQETKNIQRQKLGLSWFLPYLIPEVRILIEVLVASFFVQILGLANPLLVQVIIDRVLGQNSPSTLTIFGILLIGVAFFESILTSIRSIAFANATNRIDLSLAAKIIDHLFHLPLSYFDRRAVGELSTRIAEIDSIRQFFTNTALTTILDAAFSVIYIVVMVLYSPLLTLVALSTIPCFVFLSLIVSPIVRRQLQVKAECNAKNQSFLVEALAGIYTVKAQSMERRIRNQWQTFYDRYVAASFNSAITFTLASASSNFLNQLSSLLVLWVGASLVLSHQLTLGQLIAFRIIAGYVTGPLLRLLTIWQNFQETALSIERLSDIVDSPLEVAAENRFNIPMPLIRGQVIYKSGKSKLYSRFLCGHCGAKWLGQKYFNEITTQAVRTDPRKNYDRQL
jgi:CRP-like cAMP-binding protein